MKKNKINRVTFQMRVTEIERQVLATLADILGYSGKICFKYTEKGFKREESGASKMLKDMLKKHPNYQEALELVKKRIVAEETNH